MRTISKVIIPMTLFLVFAALIVKIAVFFGVILAICLTIKIMYF